jgi:hypothetical protein
MSNSAFERRIAHSAFDALAREQTAESSPPNDEATIHAPVN